MVRPSNRELIVDAAVELFADSGADSVTFDDLAARTGLTKSGIVYHFATRQLILEAVAGRLIDGWAESAASHLAGAPDDPPHRLAAFVAGMLEGDATPAELRLAVETLGGRRMHDGWQGIRAHWLQPEGATPAQLTAVAAALSARRHRTIDPAARGSGRLRLSPRCPPPRCGGGG
ncbi:MAG: hypothetical protein K0S49_2662 [Microbacterium sp.]|nr:hypothetical protein [Microbacterium sp.]